MPALCFQAITSWLKDKGNESASLQDENFLAICAVFIKFKGVKAQKSAAIMALPIERRGQYQWIFMRAYG